MGDKDNQDPAPVPVLTAAVTYSGVVPVLTSAVAVGPDEAETPTLTGGTRSANGRARRASATRRFWRCAPSWR